ncbi:ABC transporter substrate-binding protein [Bradyrhizobium sp. BR 10289]|uniref:ABC transporter substrate-binding protein n=1 Tax=Bradyrhizobium sp. BR 10289 TaxID=2749993 RepID=UPI001C64F72C|nr:ABC transporter substrate-binding protein [Bradyrhizobium sp. BR 10289]MBW7970540.1 ABC transporter substrate-binding protein [Bradyrhizobium sp. BR 10289]
MTDHNAQQPGVRERRTPANVLTMLVDPEPTALIALTNSGDPTMLVSGKILEGLLSYDFELNPVPQLATGWQFDMSGLKLTFTLRPNVRWHDGEPFTSADVARSIMLLKQFHPRGRSTFAGVLEVQTPDPLTAVIRLSDPAPALIRAFAGAESPMLPAHRYKEDSPTESPNEATPVGTGPFVFREWIKGSHVLLERNPAYWGAPRPFVEGLFIRFVKDPAARVAEIENGSIDIAPQTPVPVVDLDRLSRAPNLKFETRGYDYTNQIVRLEFNLDHPILGDRRVRRGIAHAIDRADLVAKAWNGYAKVVLGPISPDLIPYGAEHLVVPELDHGEAERWLDLAGFPRNAEGIRFSIDLDFVPAGDGYERTAEEVASAMAQVGIAVSVRKQEFAAYVRRLYTDREFAFSITRSNNMFDPSVGVQRIYWSRNFRKGVPFSNGSHYANPRADSLLEQAAIETDPAKRRNLYLGFQNLVVTDLPDISLLAPLQITIVNRRIRNHTVSGDGPNANFAEIAKES